MALIKDETKAVFDMSQISRGDCISIRRAGDTTFRNGFVTEVRPDSLTLLYCNIQNNATSYLNIFAVDVSGGMWEIYWTADFITINHEPEENNSGSIPFNHTTPTLEETEVGEL